MENIIRVEDLNNEVSLELIKYFGSYAAAVAQARALVSVEDGLKRGIRQVIYANFLDGYRSNKPAKKGTAITSSGGKFYWHGEQALYETVMRSAKDFITSYPLYEATSSYGTLQKNGDHPASRYARVRLSKMSEYLLEGYKENAVKEWVPSFDNESEYPLYLPSLGFWNIVNGSTGIGVGIASSIPPFNLTEMNAFLKNRLYGKESEIPLPDFPVGGTVLNRDEVIDSLINGKGSAIKIRATIEYDKKEHSLIITELPYLVFSNDVHRQLLDMQFGKEEDNKKGVEHMNPGIAHIHDATGLESRIEVFLTKDASPTKMKELIYQETSAQSYYPINLTMLVDGRHPEQMGIEKAADYYLDAQIGTTKRIYQFRKETTENQLLVNEALITVSVNIDDVIAIIKGSKSKIEAAKKLSEKYDFIDIQTKAVLSFTLGRLVGLELEALKEKKEDLENQLKEIVEVLSSEDKIKDKVAEKLDEVAKKFGKPRKTRVLNLTNKSDVIYFNEKGQATTVFNKKRVSVGTGHIGSRYFAITNTGYLLTGDEAPSRMRKVFDLKKGEVIIGVGSERSGDIINVLLDNGSMLYLDPQKEWDERKSVTHRKPLALKIGNNRLSRLSMKI